MQINKNHKSSVFSALFSDPETLRELYSAIEGVDVPPDAIIGINTLTEVIFMEQINDVSFTINDRIVVLIEHQSTINNNVPVRLLMYIARVYEKIIDRKKLYQKKLLKIPTPEFIVLYNGKAPYPDHQELRLSTAFKNIDNGSLPMELVVQIYNINQGCNPEIVEKSRTLGSYCTFMEKINEYKKELSLEKAIKAAIKYCLENDILVKFLEYHASEVENMLLTEWNMEDAIAVAREEACEELSNEILSLLDHGHSTEEIRNVLRKRGKNADELIMEDVIAAAREEAWEEGREELSNEILSFLDQGLSIEEIKRRLLNQN